MPTMPTATSTTKAGVPHRRSLDEDEDGAFALASESDDHGSDTDSDDDDDDATPSERQGLVRRSVDGVGVGVDLVANDTNDVQTAAALPEADLTVRQAVRVYRKAIFWCLVTSACVIMEGYDMILYVCAFSFFFCPRFARPPSVLAALAFLFVLASLASTRNICSFPRSRSRLFVHSLRSFTL